MVGYEKDDIGSRWYTGANPLCQSADFGGAGKCLVGALTPAEEGADLAHFSGGGIKCSAVKMKQVRRSWRAGGDRLPREVSYNN